MAEHTEQLRRQGLADIERRCGPAKRIDRRKHLYECRDGTQFLLRTNKKKILIIETNGTSADATIALEQTPNVLFSIPGATYLIPSAEIGRDARKDHETWLKQASTKGGNQTWQMIFDETDDLCHFYAVRYAQFRIAAT